VGLVLGCDTQRPDADTVRTKLADLDKRRADNEPFPTSCWLVFDGLKDSNGGMPERYRRR
jgi:hypothetical protein